MGFRFTIKLTEAGRREYDVELEDGLVHAAGAMSGDDGTACGLHAVDGWYAIGVPNNQPVTCRQCESVLLDAHSYKLKNGRFY